MDFSSESSDGKSAAAGSCVTAPGGGMWGAGGGVVGATIVLAAPNWGGLVPPRGRYSGAAYRSFEALLGPLGPNGGVCGNAPGFVASAPDGVIDDVLSFRAEPLRGSPTAADVCPPVDAARMPLTSAAEEDNAATSLLGRGCCDVVAPER